jgi:hypothetical protein
MKAITRLSHSCLRPPSRELSEDHGPGGRVMRFTRMKMNGDYSDSPLMVHASCGKPRPPVNEQSSFAACSFRRSTAAIFKPDNDKRTGAAGAGGAGAAGAAARSPSRHHR